MKAVQATLGHSTISVTMDTYAHVTPQDSVAEAMDRLFGEVGRERARSGSPWGLGS